jgi:hypothetical protein
MQPFIDLQPGAVRLEQRDADGGIVEDRAIPGLALRGCIFDWFAIRHVAGGRVVEAQRAKEPPPTERWYERGKGRYRWDPMHLLKKYLGPKLHPIVLARPKSSRSDIAALILIVSI